MINIKFLLEYDGTRYQGFAKPGVPNTILSKIRDVLLRITGEEPEIYCAVKTDPGVHAYAQTVNVRLNHFHAPSDLKTACNRALPMDIAILEAIEMPERFHAALHLKSCAYTYRIDTEEVPNIFEQKYALHVSEALRIDKMEEACHLLCGTRDFSCFSAGKTHKSTIRSLTELSLYSSPSGNELQFHLSADGFLRMMPQLLIGTLLEIGLGTKSPSDIPLIFAGKILCGSPCRAHGLYLSETHYL